MYVRVVCPLRCTACFRRNAYLTCIHQLPAIVPLSRKSFWLSIRSWQPSIQDVIIQISAAVQDPTRVSWFAQGLHTGDSTCTGTKQFTHEFVTLACDRKPKPPLTQKLCSDASFMQPGNLFAFGAQYFAEKRNASTPVRTMSKVDSIPAIYSEPVGAPTPGGSDDYQQLSEAVYGIPPAAFRSGSPAKSAHDVQRLCLTECFKQADANGDGTLDRQEFAAVLATSRLGLSQQIIDRVLAEADDNADGVIQYKCVPVSFTCSANAVRWHGCSSRLATWHK